MGRRHHLVQTQQGIILGRLLDKHVKGGSGDNSRLDRVMKVLLIDNPAPSTVDDKHPLLHLLEGIRIQQVAGLFGHGGMDGDVIGLSEKLVQTHPFDPQFFDHLGTDIGIIGNDVHFQALGPVGNDPPDPSHADNAKYLVKHLPAD